MVVPFPFQPESDADRTGTQSDSTKQVGSIEKGVVDGTKLMYHPDALARWLAGEDIAPLMAELTVASGCNHRCIFCTYEYTKFPNAMMSRDTVASFAGEFQRLGGKSVYIAGGGEPLLHPDLSGIVADIRAAGLDVAMASNAVRLTGEVAERIIPHLSWIRFSINATSPDAYTRVHRCSSQHWQQALAGVENAARSRDASAHSTTVGVQLILLPDNFEHLLEFGRTVRDLGADYLTVRSYNPHPFGSLGRPKNFRYATIKERLEEFESLSSETFKAIVRWDTLEVAEVGRRGYRRCQALPFFIHVDADGNIYSCHPYVGCEKHTYGNLGDSGFEALWKSDRRRKVMAAIRNHLDVSKCPPNCRPNAMNEYLWKLGNPPEHVNFI